MEPLTFARTNRRIVVVHIVLAALLLSGPANVARVVSGLTGILTWPLTREVRIASNNFEIFNTNLMLIYLIAVIGLNLVLQSGVMSIGHSAIFAVGAYTVAIGTTQRELSFWAALTLAGLICGTLGLLLSLPSQRLGLFTFAMVTLGYGIVAQDLAMAWRSITGGGDGLAGITRPEPFASGSEVYWLIVIATVVTYVLSRNLLRTRFGRAGKAVEESDVASQALGVNVKWVRARAFTISSVLAGIAGGLYAALLGFVAPDSFTISLAALFLLMSVLGGSGTVAGPLIGVILLFRLPIEVDRLVEQPGEWSLLAYGVALLVIVRVAPRGLMTFWWWLSERTRRRDGDEVAGADTAVVDPEVVDEEFDRLLRERARPTPASSAGLELHGVSKSFGALKVLSDVDLHVPHGQIHALIGPNGAGKTTFLNVASGYLDPDAGRVVLDGHDISGRQPFERARRGLGRTFQTPLVFDGMTAGENVMVGVDQSQRRSTFRDVLGGPRVRQHEGQVWEEACELLAVVGLGHRAAAPASTLSPGERRLLEIARVVAQHPSVLLMDEPAAGLSESDIAHLEKIIVRLASNDIGVLLVEHHVELVMRVADVVTVVNFGRVIACGPPADIVRNEAVIEAYLGVGGGTTDTPVAAVAVGAATAGTATDLPQPGTVAGGVDAEEQR